MDTQGSILIVDDNETNRHILHKIFRAEYAIQIAENGEECLDFVAEFKPDLILLDVMMPGMDGYEVCRRIKTSPLGASTQVILVSGKASTAERLRGYEAFADDYVVKPFNHDEILSKVHIQFRLLHAQQQLSQANTQLERYNTELQGMVRQQTEEVVKTRDITVFALAKLAESRDPETGEHLGRIRQYSQLLAEQLSRQGPYTQEIDDEFLENLYRASPLHDIGKVGIPDGILQKPGRLTSYEFDLMKQHVLVGAETLEEGVLQGTSGSFLSMAAEVARYHHERFNGTGYCAGLRGLEIPLSARIVALADVYDALTSQRVYKSAYLPARAKELIEEESGKHFDPAIVDAFHATYDEFLKVRNEAVKNHPEFAKERALLLGA